MKALVIGARGQVAEALRERGGAEVAAFGRPDVDLANPSTFQAALDSGKWDVVVNAAAYTAVDRAETEEETANAINGNGAGEAARLANERGLPFIHLSTDYVFDGRLDRPYREDDPVNPLGAYGRSKLLGERQVARAAARSTILRTSWVYSPFGSNFVKTMLRLGASNGTVRVVDDQIGSPTSALDMADALLNVARQRLERPDDAGLHGVFHMTGAGEGSWADFAEEIFASAERLGRSPVSVRRITTAEYPTPAARPRNSRLNNDKFAQAFGFALPDWRQSTRACVARLLAEADLHRKD